jgi:glutamate synthase (NADPH/NADH) large chain
MGGDLMTGDGAGMLLQIPHEFFSNIADEHGFSLGEKGEYGIGFLFLVVGLKQMSAFSYGLGNIKGRK